MNITILINLAIFLLICKHLDLNLLKYVSVAPCTGQCEGGGGVVQGVQTPSCPVVIC